MSNSASEIYRHVVHFKFKPEAPEDIVISVEEGFRELCKNLPFVKGFEWGINSSPENLNHGFTHCFIVTFDDASGRDEYLPHPLHQEFCKHFLDPNLENVCVVDFNVRC
ncbi:Dabb family protein [Serratia marcescens]|nr:Dabb family protein [Serratia marcescens]MBH2865757.1 Dabb family protein [Serratia marcescens]MBW4239691.1 Dabb family protein [Enterobacter roggenkampii]